MRRFMKNITKIMETPVDVRAMIFIPLVMLVGIRMMNLWAEVFGTIVYVICIVTLLYSIFKEV